jgi:hypothetical protein
VLTESGCVDTTSFAHLKEENSKEIQKKIHYNEQKNKKKKGQAFQEANPKRGFPVFMSEEFSSSHEKRENKQKNKKTNKQTKMLVQSTMIKLIHCGTDNDAYNESYNTQNPASK